MASPPSPRSDIFQSQQQIRDMQQQIREMADEYDRASVRRKFQIQQETESLRIQIFVNRDFIASLREQIRLTGDLERAEERAANARKRQAQQNLQAAQQTSNTLRQLFSIASTSGPQGLIGYAIGKSISGLMNAAAGVPQAQAAVNGTGGGASGGDAAGGAAQSAAMALAALAIGAGAVVTGLQQLQHAAVQFGQYASPAQTARLQRAQEDFMASIGISLLPLVDAAARTFDRFNATMTKLQPILEPLFQEIASLMEASMKGVTDAIQMLRPEILQVVAALRELVSGLRGTVRWIGQSEAYLIEIASRLRVGNLNMTGVGAAAERRLQGVGYDSMTIAARPARYIATEEIGREARLASFGARSISEQQLQAQQETNGILANIYTILSPQPIDWSVRGRDRSFAEHGNAWLHTMGPLDIVTTIFNW